MDKGFVLDGRTFAGQDRAGMDEDRGYSGGGKDSMVLGEGRVLVFIGVGQDTGSSVSIVLDFDNEIFH